MMKSNFWTAGDSRPRPIGTRAIETRNAKKSRNDTGRSFIIDLYYLKSLLTRRKFEANLLAPFAIQERPGNWRHPAHPVSVGVALVHAHDPIAGFAAIGFAHPDAGAEPDNITRAAGRGYDLRRLQTFLDLPDALIEPRQLPFRVGIIARFRQLRARDFNEPLKFVAQL